MANDTYCMSPQDRQNEFVAKYGTGNKPTIDKNSKEAWNMTDEEWAAHGLPFPENYVPMTEDALDEQERRSDYTRLARSMIKPLSYGHECTTRGTDSTTGHDATFEMSSSVADGHCDAYTSGCYAGYNDLRMGNWSETHEYSTWMTFDAIAIPQGATINYAFIRFIASGHDFSGFEPVDLVICAEDTDTPTSWPNNWPAMQGKIRTTYQKEWSCVDWDDTGGVRHTPNIACVVQELVDREDWDGTEDVRIFVDWDSSNAYIKSASFDHPTYDAPVLRVFWSLVEDVTPDGGAIAGGGAHYFGSQTMTPLGGAVLGGGADIGPPLVFNEVAEGGITVEGVASDTQFCVEIASGGVVVSGLADVKPYFEVGSGGAVCCGTAGVTSFVNETMQGGGVLGIGWFDNGFKLYDRLTHPQYQVDEALKKFHFSPVLKIDPADTDGSSYLVTEDDGTSVIYHDAWRYSDPYLHISWKADLDRTADNVFKVFYKP
ncbi:MAG: hypothetical protein ACYST6_17215 [Planctomycetota bacterium]